MTAAACAWLGLFPLLHLGSFHTITQDKHTLMLLLAALTLPAFLADARARRLSRPGRLPLFLAGGLLGWMLLSALCSPYPAAVWWTGSGRLEGLSTQLVYLALFLLFAFARVRRAPVLFSAAGGLAVFLAVVLRQRAGGNPFGLYPEGYSFDNAFYFQGTIGNVDMCSGYLAVVCGLFLPALAESLRQLIRPRPERGESRRRALPAAAGILAVLAAAVFLLRTINVQSGLLALAVLLVWAPLSLLPKKARLPLLALALAVLLLAVFLAPVSSGPLWELQEILRGRPQPSFGSGRLGVWLRTLRMLRSQGRWLEGTGPDTFALRFNRFLQAFYANHPEIERMEDYFDSPHCEYLAWVVNAGVPALLLFLGLICAGCMGNSPFSGGVLGYAVQACLSFSVCIVAPLFWVVLGLSCAAGPWVQKQRQEQKEEGSAE